jgi:hypothetical protein
LKYLLAEERFKRQAAQRKFKGAAAAVRVVNGFPTVL